MHVVQVGFTLDRARREPEALLEAWPTLVDLASAAVGGGVRVSVLQAAHRDAVLDRAGVRFHFVAARGALGRPSRGLLERARALRPDVLHVHGLAHPFQTHTLSRALPRTPVLAQDHASRPPPPLRRPLHRWGFSRLDAVAFTARAQADPFFEAGVLRRGVPVLEIVESSSRFTAGDVEAARRRTGLHGDPCLLWVGRLNENKHPLAVLDAIAIAAETWPALRLWCCYGDAPLLDRVRARIVGDPLLADRVRLLGRVPHDEVEHLLRAADFLVLGSHREGSGFAVIEAMACGTTPLVTDIPSFRRITGDGEFGALSPPGDAEAMARAIGEWAARDRPTLRRRTRGHFEQELSFEALGRSLRNAYRVLRPSALGAGLGGADVGDGVPSGTRAPMRREGTA